MEERDALLNDPSLPTASKQSRSIKLYGSTAPTVVAQIARFITFFMRLFFPATSLLSLFGCYDDVALDIEWLF